MSNVRRRRQTNLDFLESNVLDLVVVWLWVWMELFKSVTIPLFIQALCVTFPFTRVDAKIWLGRFLPRSEKHSNVDEQV